MTPGEAHIRCLKALAESRRLDNQTVQDNREVANWRREVDILLRGTDFDDPHEQYDTPARVEARQRISRMFDPRPA